MNTKVNNSNKKNIFNIASYLHSIQGIIFPLLFLVCSLITLTIFENDITDILNFNNNSNSKIYAASISDLSGSGTQNSPYLIKNHADLANFASLVNDGNSFEGKYIKLTNDIDLAAKFTRTYSGSNSYTDYDPSSSTYKEYSIGLYSYGTSQYTIAPFKGTFDGDNHIIYNASNFIAFNSTSSPTKESRYSLFAYISKNAVIKNLTVEGNISLSDSFNGNELYTGGIVGYAELEGGGIYNCVNKINYTNNSSTTSDIIIGGIVGYINAKSLETINIKDCVNAGILDTKEVGGTRYLGGIIGKVSANAKLNITNCTNLIHLSASLPNSVADKTIYISGIANIDVSGNAANTVVNKCYNKGTLLSGSSTSSSHKYISPIVSMFPAEVVNSGNISSNAVPKISNSYYAIGSILNFFIGSHTASGSSQKDLSKNDLIKRHISLTYDESNRCFNITNFDDLNTLSTFVIHDVFDCTNVCFKQTNDIALSTTTSMRSIGYNEDRPFKGIYDGAGHTISDVKYYGDLNGSFTSYGISINANYIGEQLKPQALFAYTDGATIKNLTIAGNIATGERHFVVGHPVYLAGIIGDANNTTISSCINKININTRFERQAFVGGIVSVARGNTKINNCINEGDINATLYIPASSTIWYTYQTSMYAAGIVGQIVDSSNVTIEDCLNTGNIYVQSMKNEETNCVLPSCDKEYAVASGIGNLYPSMASSTVKLSRCLSIGQISTKRTLSSKNSLSYSPIQDDSSICFPSPLINYDNNSMSYKPSGYYIDNGLRMSSTNDPEAVVDLALASGEVAFKLGSNWFQDLSEENHDAYPKPIGNKRVYKFTHYACKGCLDANNTVGSSVKYSNSISSSTYGEHVFSALVEDDKLKLRCSYCSEECWAKLLLPRDNEGNIINYYYNDDKIEPAQIEYSSNWDKTKYPLEIQYNNSDQVGVASAILKSANSKFSEQVELNYQLLEKEELHFKKPPKVKPCKVNTLRSSVEFFEEVQVVDNDGNVIDGVLDWKGIDILFSQAKEYTQTLEFIPNNELYNNKYKTLNKDIIITVEVNPTLEGEGSMTVPFLIKTLDELIAISNNVRDGTTYKDCYFKLANDITLSSTNKFTPIGVYKDYELGDNSYSAPILSLAFEGTFDGNNHTISNISKDVFKESDMFPSNSKYTIFGYTKGATIKNLVLSGNITSSESKDNNEVVRIASLVGFADETNISNITNNVNYNITSNTRLYVGGIASQAHNNCQIDYCTNNGKITTLAQDNARIHVGGAIGIITNSLESKAFSISNILNANDISLKGQYVSSSQGFDSYKISAGGIIGLSIANYQASKKPNLTNILNLGNIQASYTSSGNNQDEEPYKSPIIGYVKHNSQNIDDSIKDINTNKIYYKDNTDSSISIYYVPVSDEEIQKGEIAYLLNWYQNLTMPKDSAPTLDKSHNKVYENITYLCPDAPKSSATIEYSNTKKDPIYNEHDLSYKVQDNMFIETCSHCNHNQSCAVNLLVYTYSFKDEPIKPAVITTYSDNFLAKDTINTDYENNLSPGQAKAVVTFKNLKIELLYEITERKVPVIYKLPKASKITVNSKLKSSILDGGEVRDTDNDTKIEGIFSWLNPEDIISTIGITSKKAIFTPLNTDLFKSLQFDIDIETYIEDIMHDSNQDEEDTTNASKKKSSKLCSVSFNTNGAEKINNITVKRGRCISSKDLTIPTKEGYTFEGWYRDSECTNKFDIESSINTNLDLYAKWKKSEKENIEDNNISQKTPKSIVTFIINSKIAKYNDDNIMLDVVPIAINSRCYAPLRFVAQGLGTNVSWMSKTKTATLTNEDKVLEINTKTNVITTTDKKTNKTTKETLKDMFVKDGRIMAPVRFISEAFDALVEWTRKTNTVTITK